MHILRIKRIISEQSKDPYFEEYIFVLTDKHHLKKKPTKFKHFWERVSKYYPTCYIYFYLPLHISSNCDAILIIKVEIKGSHMNGINIHITTKQKGF